MPRQQVCSRSIRDERLSQLSMTWILTDGDQRARIREIVGRMVIGLGFRVRDGGRYSRGSARCMGGGPLSLVAAQPHIDGASMFQYPPRETVHACGAIDKGDGSSIRQIRSWAVFGTGLLGYVGLPPAAFSSRREDVCRPEVSMGRMWLLLWWIEMQGDAGVFYS
ncbi:hypothetical protein ARMSODRAFT_1017015 [Armillaria solidipes]|uniref:Uncharacterized protein n=1 Tax=Armillaria solidipes TaxID=1076256 RepID=A0A2H3BVP5_9AGAR|nr:hypothetical protein ARMSODRAFT_1017015 [Armillaria solidipes]